MFTVTAEPKKGSLFGSPTKASSGLLSSAKAKKAKSVTVSKPDDGFTSSKTASKAVAVKTAGSLSKRGAPKSSSAVLTEARKAGVDLERLSKDVESGRVKIRNKDCARPETEAQQKTALLRNAAKIFTMIKMVEDLIIIKKKTKEIYALNNLYMRQMDVLKEIRAIKNIDQDVARFEEHVTEPNYRRIISIIGEMAHSLKAELRDKTPVDKHQDMEATINTAIRRAKQSLEESYSQAREAATRVLSGQVS